MMIDNEYVKVAVQHKPKVVAPWTCPECGESCCEVRDVRDTDACVGHELECWKCRCKFTYWEAIDYSPYAVEYEDNGAEFEIPPSAEDLVRHAAPDLLQALERAELSTTQIRLAANIGRTSAKSKVAWYVGQLEQLGREIRAAIEAAKEGE